MYIFYIIVFCYPILGLSQIDANTKEKTGRTYLTVNCVINLNMFYSILIYGEYKLSSTTVRLSLIAKHIGIRVK